MLFSSIIPRPPTSTLFPYTTLFRSIVCSPRSSRCATASLSCGEKIGMPPPLRAEDRKSTRLNSSHRCISYAVFCLKKKTSHYRGVETVQSEFNLHLAVHYDQVFKTS